MKRKNKSLKSLYVELLEYVSKNYSNDENIIRFTSEISKTQETINKKKEEKKKLLENNKSVKKLAKLSISTLSLCNNLISVEKLHNKLMNITNQELEIAESEIKVALFGDNNEERKN
jgi:hypothetical protein